MTTQAEHLDGELTLTNRIMPASNATFFGHIDNVAVVHKPIAGERPLWDFPAGTLAHREVAAYLISEALGWNLVPRTWLRDGQFGAGMTQLWQDVDLEQRPVDLVQADEIPENGWCHVFDGLDPDENVISLIHEDSALLRQITVFDIVTNNADRKGSHILPLATRHRYGIDHGLTFHTDNKLRTVLWGWLGHELNHDELAGIDRLIDGLSAGLGEALVPLLTGPELDALADRCHQLRREPVFPRPDGTMPAIPWPPL